MWLVIQGHGMRLKKNKSLQLQTGAAMITLLLGALILVWSGADFSVDINMDIRLLSPSPGHPLGTDDLGRDLLCAVTYGTSISLLVGIVVVAVSALLGTLIGLVAGLAGGWLEGVAMRCVDVVLAFPGILLAVALAAFLDPGLLGLVGLLIFCGWAGYARLVRGEVLRYRQAEFILAARSYNAPWSRILFHQLPPLILPLVWVQASLGLGGVVLAESGLNFLGLGLDPVIPTLGQILAGGLGHLMDRPLMMVVPGCVLVWVVLASVLLADGLSDRGRP